MMLGNRHHFIFLTNKRLAAVSPHQLALGQDVTLHGLDDVCSFGAGLQPERLVQGIELEHVVMRFAPGRAGTHVTGLTGPVISLCANPLHVRCGWHSFRETT